MSADQLAIIVVLTSFLISGLFLLSAAPAETGATGIAGSDVPAQALAGGVAPGAGEPAGPAKADEGPRVGA